ncbi:hypothetical protein PV08_08757 [Exophiala spinifera]|uniref:Uncharacterized protein n=1 Tax=Exophiala spinifera TaxID=91928 RepID=A0A0D2BQX6_9EURO|nr:uncharacterized protein PV08_08757 [Exophiala spinifera]KIW13569.1 hypothetical protein PV08_08757 [Exophiala spinifera]
MSTTTKILLTGATGYIGGEILANLLKSKYDSLKASAITCVVRGDKAEALKDLGVKIIQFNTLDETEILADAAAEHDGKYNAPIDRMDRLLIEINSRLAKRKKNTGRDVHYIHTSGTSNVADRPVTKQYLESGYPLSDKEDIFSYLKKRDEDVPYAQRTSDVVVTEVGLEYGVKTYIMMMPCIYGIGAHPLHEFCHVPILIRSGLKLGKVPVVGDGSAIWDHVHVEDMASCYELILHRILTQQDVPSGKDGIYFVENGEHTWQEIGQRVADAGVAIGALETNELRSLDLAEAKDILGRGWGLIAEIGWASNSRTRGHKARALGWTPQKGEDVWKSHFTADWEAILKSNSKI